MALEPDGRIVEAGYPHAPGPYHVIVARFLATGPRIDTFSASANSVSAGDTVALTASVTTLNPGSTVTQVAFYLDSNGDGILEPGTDKLLGYGTLIGGVWTSKFSTTGWMSGKYFAQAADSYGVLSDPLALDLQVL
jgi:hypothetical protein